MAAHIGRYPANGSQANARADAPGTACRVAHTDAATLAGQASAARTITTAMARCPRGVEPRSLDRPTTNAAQSGRIGGDHRGGMSDGRPAQVR